MRNRSRGEHRKRCLRDPVRCEEVDIELLEQFQSDTIPEELGADRSDHVETEFGRLVELRRISDEEKPVGAYPKSHSLRLIVPGTLEDPSPNDWGSAVSDFKPETACCSEDLYVGSLTVKITIYRGKTALPSLSTKDRQLGSGTEYFDSGIPVPVRLTSVADICGDRNESRFLRRVHIYALDFAKIERIGKERRQVDGVATCL